MQIQDRNGATLAKRQYVTVCFQSLSSRYAVVLGGYGPGYQELKEVEVVKHNKVCQGAIR